MLLRAELVIQEVEITYRQAERGLELFVDRAKYSLSQRSHAEVIVAFIISACRPNGLFLGVKPITVCPTGAGNMARKIC